MKHIRFLLAMALCVVLCMMGGVALAGQSGDYFYTDNGDGTCTLTDYAGKSGKPVFPAALNGLRVTEIGSHVFSMTNTMNILGVTLPDTVTAIADSAFADCGNMTAIVIPDRVERIGAEAFSNCRSLQQVTFCGTAPASIGSKAFFNVPATVTYQPGESWAGKIQQYGGYMTWLPLGETSGDFSWYLADDYALHLEGTGSMTVGLMSTWKNGFYRQMVETVYVDERLSTVITACFDTEVFPNLKQVYFGATWRDFRYDYFDGVAIYFGGDVNGNIAWAYTPDRTLTLRGTGDMPDYTDNNAPWYMLGNLGLVDRIVVEEGITGIGACAFSQNSAEEVTLPSTLVRLGVDAFFSSRLTSVSIPDGVEVIPASCFSNCTKLTEARLPAGLKTLETYAFANTALTSIDLPVGLETIGYGAFGECMSLTAIDVPDTVTAIGDRAFQGCSAAQRLVLGKSVKSIGAYAFELCCALPEIVIPDSVESIGAHAFQDCDAAASLTIGQSVKTIGDYAFFGCEELPAVVIPDSVERIGNWAFAECWAVTSLALGKGVKTIGDYAFSGCLTLGAINVPGNVETIGEGAFYDCPKAATVTLAEGIGVIGARAFEDCDRMTKIVVPQSVTVLGAKAFYHCDRLTTATLPAGLDELSAELFSYCKLLKTVNMPSQAASIGAKAFFMCEALPALPLPESLESIGSEAFAGCIKLTDVVLPESLRTMDSKAYAFCSVVGHIVLPDNMTYVAPDINSDGGPEVYYANGTLTETTVMACGASFTPILTINVVERADGTYDRIVTYCAPLAKHVVVPRGVTEIADSAFSNHSELLTVSLPETLERIGDWAFYCCEQLQGVEIPDSVLTIGDYAFMECRAMETLVIADGVMEVGEDAFTSCTALKEVTIPGSMDAVSNGMFKHCTALEKVTIEEGVTKIGQNAFPSCTALREINLPESLVSIGAGALLGCSALENITIPKSVESIGEVAFAHCQKLERVELPDGLKKIEISLFSECSALQSVVIPASVQTIGSGAFGGCWALEDITLPEGIKVIEANTFNECYALKELTIPESVTTVKEGAFSSCFSAELYLPGNITQVSYGAFCDSADQYPGKILQEMDCPTAFALGEQGYLYTVQGDKTLYLEARMEEGSKVFTLVNTDRSVTEVAVPEGVTRIRREAFYQREQLVKVTLPGTVTSIGERAFSGCANLTDVTMPDSVVHIGESGFEDCTALEIRLPGRLTDIGENALNSVKQVILPQLDCPAAFALSAKNIDYAVEGVENQLFRASRSGEETDFMLVAAPDVEEISVMEGVTTIREGIFAGYRSLTKVKLPQTLREIEGAAFRECVNLTQVNVPEGVKRIGDNAFWGCTSLEIHLPAHVEEVGVYVFSGVARVTVPEVNCAAAFAMGENDNRYRVVGVEGLVFEARRTTEGERVRVYEADADIVQAYVPEGVTEIEHNAFYGRKNLTVVTLPGTLKRMGRAAFEGCEALAEVSIPDSVTEMDERAFYGCTALAKAKLPAGMTRVETSTFQNCTALKDVELPSGVTSIGVCAFEACTALAHLVLPETVTTIEQSAFGQCAALVLEVPENLSEVHAYGVNSVKKCMVPRADCAAAFVLTQNGVAYSVKGAENLLFSAYETEDGTNVQVVGVDADAVEVVVPEGVTSIGYYAFGNHQHLAKITLPDTLRMIASYAFDSNTALKEMTIPEGVTVIPPYAFSYCTALEAVNLPKSLETIESNAFMECPALKELRVPDKVTAILERALDTSAATKVYLPANVTSMGGSALGGDAAIILPEINCPTAFTLGERGYTYCTADNEALFYRVNALAGAFEIAGATPDAVEVVIPESAKIPGLATKMADCAFRRHENLEKITIPEGVEVIGSMAFEGCKKLKEIHIPASVWEIWPDAFNDMPEGFVIRSAVNVPAHTWALEHMIAWAHDVHHEVWRAPQSPTCTQDGYTEGTYCDECGEVFSGEVIPAAHTEVVDPAMAPTHVSYGRTEGTHCCICGEVLRMPETLEMYKDPLNYTPAGLKDIQAEAFMGATLRCMIVREGCQTIGARAFADCADLLFVEIPATVTSIDRSAFTGCRADFVIVTSSGSAAEQLAQELGIACVTYP